MQIKGRIVMIAQLLEYSRGQLKIILETFSNNIFTKTSKSRSHSSIFTPLFSNVARDGYGWSKGLRKDPL